jgi:hypothetical protein
LVAASWTRLLIGVLLSALGVWMTARAFKL